MSFGLDYFGISSETIFNEEYNFDSICALDFFQ